MIGTFEVTATRRGERIVKYYTVVLKDGIADTIYNLCKRYGCTDINVHLMA